MSSVPQNVPGFPTPDPNAYYASQQAQLIQQQVQAQVSRLESEYRTKLDDEIKKLTEDLKNTLAARSRYIAIALVSSVVAAFAILISVQTREVNQGVIGFQNSVMTLQKEVLSTASGLGEKASLIAAANRELEIATTQLESSAAKYESRLSGLDEARRQLEAVSRSLSETKGAFDARLRSLNAAGR